MKLQQLIEAEEIKQKGFHIDLENRTKSNEKFRDVLYTTPQMQLVLMSLKPQEDIGIEVHPNTSQFIRVDSGSGEAILGDNRTMLEDGDAIVIPPGVRHNIIASNKGMKLYVVYSPPNHKRGAEQENKGEKK